MVRGQLGCKSLCTTCRQDCICSCQNCHYCFAKPRIGDTQNHIHDCGTSSELVSSTFKLVRLFQSEAYTVTVGSDSDKRDFHVHREALSKNSRYFKALFKFNSIVESKAVVLNTPVDKPDAFGCFIQFAYMQDYFCSEMGNGQDLLSHAEVYVLAERLEAFELKDLALKRATPICVALSKLAKDGAKDDASWSVGQVGIRTLPEVIQTIYQNTPSPPSTHTAASTPLTEKAEGGVETTTTAEIGEKAVEIVTPLSLPSNDRFRILVSRLAASCLDILKRSSSFSECLSDCPEFAQDMVKNLTQAKPLELDANGELKE